jgi:hypothetical protein
VDTRDERRRQGRLSHDEYEDLVQAIWERIQLQLSRVALRAIALIVGSSGVMAFIWDAAKEALKK